MKFQIAHGLIKIGSLCFLLALAGQTAVAQTTYQWTQTAGGAQSWTNPANWSGGVVPSPAAGDSIIFVYPANQVAATTVDLGADRTAELWKYSKNGGFDSGTFTIAAGYTINLAGTSPTIEAGPGADFIFNNVLAGTSGLAKTGSGTLRLNNAANSFSGGIEFAGGALTVASDARLGDAGNEIVVTGGTTFNFSSGTYARNLALSNGAVVTMNGNVTLTISGPVTGDGGIANQSTDTFGSSSVSLSSTANTFTGPLTVGVGTQGAVTITLNSLADSASSITLTSGSNNARDSKFVWGSGAISAITLNQRQIVLAGGYDHVIENSNTNPANTIAINQDVSATSTSSNRKLILQGVNTGDNIIAGVISNGVSDSTTSLEKSGSGTWVLSGVNTYTGSTTVSGGILKLAASECLADAGTLTINGGKLELAAGVGERIDNLILGSITQTTNTTYGSFASSAEIQDDTRFAGTGMLFLGMDPPPQGTVIIVK